MFKTTQKFHDIVIIFIDMITHQSFGVFSMCMFKNPRNEL
ncbi:hypothetical protein SPSINT_1318 [Staphylococcus pseudintermedius HKU10-03]|nr:hypothetical protein SPSINT_1318 [Staphylococcus pseudintermedius HKU10-03]ADX76507.1 hypothetical protein SPSE_1238 [Staphylococcus pseudintermedius ED99]